MTETTYCEICAGESGHMGVCYGCVMGMEEIGKLTRNTQMIKPGLWSVSTDNDHYLVIDGRLYTWDSTGDKWLSTPLEEWPEIIEYFTKLAVAGAHS